VHKGLVRGLQLTATLVVTGFILHRVGIGVSDVRALDPAVWRPAPLPLVGASLVLVAGYFFSALLWGRMVIELGGPPLGILPTLRLYMLANLGRYVPGKVWQLAGMMMLARRAGVSGGIAAGAAVLGQGVSLAGAGVIGAGAFLGGGAEFRWIGLLLLAGGALFVLLPLAPALFRTLLEAGFRIIRRPTPESLDPGRSFGARWLALNALNWALYSVAFWGLARSLGYAIPLPEAGSAFAAAWLMGYLALFAPAGVGVREGFLVAFLQPELGTGAIALAVVARLWMTAVEIVPAAVLAFIPGGGAPGGPSES